MMKAPGPAETLPIAGGNAGHEFAVRHETTRCHRDAGEE
jgi:hypothetical protein